jgi:hypothetical protein
MMQDSVEVRLSNHHIISIHSPSISVLQHLRIGPYWLSHPTISILVDPIAYTVVQQYLKFSNSFGFLVEAP